MIFDLLIICGALLLIGSYPKQYVYPENSNGYKFWYSIFNLGFWMVFTGLLKYIL